MTNKAYGIYHNDYLERGETWLDYDQLNVADCVLKLKAAHASQRTADQLLAEVAQKKTEGLESLLLVRQRLERLFNR